MNRECETQRKVQNEIAINQSINQSMSRTQGRDINFQGRHDYRFIIENGKKPLLGLNGNPVKYAGSDQKVTVGNFLGNIIKSVFEDKGVYTYESHQSGRLKPQIRVGNYDTSFYSEVKDNDSVLNLFTDFTDGEDRFVIDDALKAADTTRVKELCQDVPEANIFKIRGIPEGISDLIGVFQKHLYPKKIGGKLTDEGVANLTNSFTNQLNRITESNIFR